MKRTPPEPLRPKARDVDWRYVAEQLGCSRGTAHTRLLGLTDPDERKRAGV